MDHATRTVKLTPVSVLHYVRLAYRSLLFLGLFALYLDCRLRGGEDVLTAMEKRPMILVLILVEMKMFSLPIPLSMMPFPIASSLP